MSRHDPNIVLNQILSHAREAVEISRGRTRSDLETDRLLNLALARLIEIIDEAANCVPDSIQAQYPHLPWLQMSGARNRLIHAYDSVDFDILLIRNYFDWSSDYKTRKDFKIQQIKENFFMKLSRPKIITWWIAVILGVLGILATLLPIPVLSAFAFWLVAAGFILLVLATALKGL